MHINFESFFDMFYMLGGEYPPMLPRDVTDNAAMFPMVNQIYKEFLVSYQSITHS